MGGQVARALLCLRHPAIATHNKFLAQDDFGAYCKKATTSGVISMLRKGARQASSGEAQPRAHLLAPTDAHDAHKAPHGRRRGPGSAAPPATLAAAFPGGAAVAMCWALGAFMAWWVLAAPASYRAAMGGPDRAFPLEPDFPAPSDVFTKYAGHIAVAALHTLPSAVWALLAPLQLHLGLRRRFPRAHRVAGRSLLGLSCCLLVGYCLIDARGLAFSRAAHWEWTMRASALWFAATALQAWRHARARRYEIHGRWALRHLASGMWVALMRLGVMAASGVPVLRSTDPGTKDAVFGACFWLGWLVAVGGTEAWLWRWRRRPKLHAPAGS